MSATLPHGKVLIEEALTGVVYPRKKRIAQTPVSKLSKFKNPFCDDYESKKQWINKDKGVERLREFIRFGYMTASEVARGIPKPRQRPFCKAAKGEIRKSGRTYPGVCHIVEGLDRGEKVTMKR